MNDISQWLEIIRTAIYGKDMREAIYNSLDALAKSRSDVRAMEGQAVLLATGTDESEAGIATKINTEEES